MSRSLSRSALIALVIAQLPRAASAQSAASICNGVVGNLVADCGFESGSLAGWSVPTPPNSPAIVSTVSPNSGAYSAAFNQVGGFGISNGYGAIRQTLATAVGQTYTISFFGFTNAAGLDNGIRLLFGGVSVFSQALQNGVYQQFTTTGVATGSSTVFEVQGFNNPGRDYVDDFVITAGVTPPPTTTTPEPATWTLMGAGLLALGAAERRRRLAAA